MQKSFQTTIVIIFFLMLLFVPVYWMIPGKTVIKYSLIESRDLEEFPTMQQNNLNQFANRSFQKKIELAASDQFPYRIPAIQNAKAVDRVMIRLAYLFQDDPAIPADTRSRLYVMRDNSMMMPTPATFGNTIKTNIDGRIENYKKLMKQNPDVNFYAFYLETLTYSPFHPLNKYFKNSDRRQALQYFEENKPEGLFFSKMLLSSLEDHRNYFYRSDHHWNIHGAWKGYEEIYKLIAPQYPQISPLLKLNGIKTFSGVIFYGSWARRGFYPFAPDIFEVADVDLPPYKIYNRAGKQIEYNQMKLFEAGDYSTEPFVDYYLDYYGHNFDVIEYEFENNAPRNLIIIGSSFSRPVSPLIAANYRHTYVIDLRTYKDFSLGKFIKQYNINDVLVLGDIMTIGDPLWKINP